jgi:hypothetical protein
MQVAMIPVVHTIGTSFRPAERKPSGQHIHWDQW